jgi:hypothetical protein
MFRLGEKKERPLPAALSTMSGAYRLPKNTMAIDRIVVDARKPTEARAKEGWGVSPADVVSMLMPG